MSYKKHLTSEQGGILHELQKTMYKVPFTPMLSIQANRTANSVAEVNKNSALIPYNFLFLLTVIQVHPF